MANYSEYRVNYGNIWFNMGPNACNWIIGTQESHENAIQTVWEGYGKALEHICSERGGFGGFLKKPAMMACISPQCQDMVLGCYRS